MARLTTLFALAVLTACSGGAGEETGVEDSSANLDADPDVDNFVPDAYPPVAPTTAIFFGDSITAGVGAGPGLSWTELLVENDDAQWAAYAAADFEDEYPSLTTVVNVAEGGARTADLQAQITAAEAQLTLPVSGPVVIGVTIGGNDLVNVIYQPSTANQVVAGIQSNFEAFVAWTEDTTKFPDGAYLYIANVYDPSDGVGTAESCFFGFDTTAAVTALGQVNTNTRTLASQRGFSVVDMHGHFMGHGLNYTMTANAVYDAEDPTLWFESDCIHPNVRGHHELRRVFFAAMIDETLQHEIP